MFSISSQYDGSSYVVQICDEFYMTMGFFFHRSIGGIHFLKYMRYSSVLKLKRKTQSMKYLIGEPCVASCIVFFPMGREED